MSKLCVFCLPYAGGSKSIYYDWIDRYSDIVEIIPIEYSGHASRLGEELFFEAEAMVDDVFNKITEFNPKDYVIYGHSMGSVIALLTCFRLEKKYVYPPKALIVGGIRPPHLKYKDEKWADLSKKQLFDKLYSLGQMSDEIMNEPELLDMLYDIFKADISINEENINTEGLMLHVPIVAMTGVKDDEAPIDDMKEWKMYTDNWFELKIFNDHHFFPFTSEVFKEYFRMIIKKIIV